ncbi:MAG: aldehyde dehydrogenase family protein [Bdellovibrionales bacterium]|nr:aldehyde dehydrogenase family protein [Bdellovibrionales bacterium]
MEQNKFSTFNPASEELNAQYFYHSEKQINDKIDLLSKQYGSWKQESIAVRLKTLERIQKAFLEETESLALLITTEMGKPLREAKSEVLKSISVFQYYSQYGEKLLETQNVQTSNLKSEVHFHPLGVVLSFMPWNFPLWQVIRFAVPAWLAGNVILLKHSEITAGVSTFIERIVNESSSKTLIQNIFIEPEKIDFLYSRPEVRAITFTGSTQVGALVAQQAGKNLKKTVLELGGSDAYIIDDSAKMEDAVELAVKAKLINNGQSCVAAKRFFVSRKKTEEFLYLFCQKLIEKKIGSPLDENIDLGPLAQLKFKDKITNQVKQLSRFRDVSYDSALESLKGTQLPDKGCFFAPELLVFSNISDSNEKIFRESFQNDEIFGPVGLVYSYENKEDLITRVNQSEYGLGAAWFGDEDKFKKENWFNLLDVGMVAVNEIIRSDAKLPFGGVKKSGYGRELGAFGIYEFCNIKTLGWGQVE